MQSHLAWLMPERFNLENAVANNAAGEQLPPTAGLGVFAFERAIVHASVCNASVLKSAWNRFRTQMSKECRPAHEQDTLIRKLFDTFFCWDFRWFFFLNFWHCRSHHHCHTVWPLDFKSLACLSETAAAHQQSISKNWHNSIVPSNQQKRTS